MNFMLEALIKKLEGEIEIAKANVLVYTRNPSGIGEHPEVVEAIESQISKIAEAQDKINTINLIGNHVMDGIAPATADSQHFNHRALRNVVY